METQTNKTDNWKELNRTLRKQKALRELNNALEFNYKDKPTAEGIINLLIQKELNTLKEFNRLCLKSLDFD